MTNLHADILSHLTGTLARSLGILIPDVGSTAKTKDATDVVGAIYGSNV